MKQVLFLTLLFINFFGFCEPQEFMIDAIVKIQANYSVKSVTEPYKITSQNWRTGSGFFFDEKGHILTNYHVIRQTKTAIVRIPRFGEKDFIVTVKSVYPDLDIALLELSAEDVAWIKNEIGFLPYLSFADSNDLTLGDKIIIYGYPAESSFLKTIKCDIRGFEYGNLVTSAGNNAGNSGGPVLNKKNEVIGIYSAYERGVENMAYAIPINNVLSVIPDMLSHPILYNPFLGVATVKGDKDLTNYYTNPTVFGGCYVIALCKSGLLAKAGIQEVDMIHKVDSYIVDERGRILVPWRPNAINITEYLASIPQGQSVHVTAYRQGKELSFNLIVDRTKKPNGIQKTHHGSETIDYEIFGGFVIMQLSQNIVDYFRENNGFAGLQKYTTTKYSDTNVLIITEIFSCAPAYCSQNIDYAAIIESINDQPVSTLEEYRKAIAHAVENNQYIVFGVKHTRHATNYRSLFVIPVVSIVENEEKFAKENLYNITPFTQSIIETLKKTNETKKTA